jgi:polyisoprenoid-binding protein YceI
MGERVTLFGGPSDAVVAVACREPISLIADLTSADSPRGGSVDPPIRTRRAQPILSNMTTISPRANEAPAPDQPGWEIDAAQSTVAFRVRHLHFKTVHGCFRRFSGVVTPGVIEGAVDVGSVDTGDDIRDGRLRSAGFFDAAVFPEITFEASGPLAPVVVGSLTICGVTRPVAINVSASGTPDAPRLHGATSVSRKDFGLTWSGLVQAGEAVIGDRVDIELDVALTRPVG